MNKKSAILDKYLLTNNTTEYTKTNYCRQIEENQIEIHMGVPFISCMIL